MQFCRKVGLITGQLVAIDGSKFQAVAAARKHLNLTQLKRQQEKLEKHIAAYLAQLDEADQTDQAESAEVIDRTAIKATLLRLQGALESGAFTNTLALNWKPGYTDQTYVADDGTVRIRNADGTPGAFVDIEGWKVPAYTTVDWQGKWAFDKSLSVTAGVKNLMDKKPPLSIKTVGGNMLGFDPRYADGVGRSFYLQAGYKF